VVDQYEQLFASMSGLDLPRRALSAEPDAGQASAAKTLSHSA